MLKIAILVLADVNETHGSRGRVRNALEVAKECKESGDDVQLIFDGGGTASLAAILQSDHKMHGLYQAITAKVVGACAYCAQAFHIKDDLVNSAITLLYDYDQHPSLRSYLVNGYQILTF